MSTDVHQLKADLKRVQNQIALIEAKLKALEQEQGGATLPFSELEGAWKGANFTDEEIDAAKIKVKDLPD